MKCLAFSVEMNSCLLEIKCDYPALFRRRDLALIATHILKLYLPYIVAYLRTASAGAPVATSVTVTVLYFI